MAAPDPVHPRVLHVIHNPIMPNARGRKLNRALGWNDPDDLAAQYIEDVREASHGYANYEIVERVEVDDFTPLIDGFKYTPEHYMRCWRARGGFHKPDEADYLRILDQFDAIAKINRGEIDEVWLSAYPWAGYYESRMAGPGAFWCNAPPLERTGDCQRRFVIMGFNYERGVGEMLENLGHRAEAILTYVFNQAPPYANLWERFIRHERSHPGRSEVGTIHYAPNSEHDYDWGNPRTVQSRAHVWLKYPDLTGQPRPVNCQQWGSGDTRAHHLWWFRHLPHVEGESTHGISHNWWEYVIDPNRV